MNSVLTVARLHLADRMSLTWLPWVVLVLTLGVNIVIASLVPLDGKPFYSGGLITLYGFMLGLGAHAMTKSLAFALELGITRRAYYVGTLTTVGMLAIPFSLVQTALWWLEGATDGWGLTVHFFRVPGFFDHPGRVLLGGIVFLAFAFILGMWSGLVYTRWKLIGVVVFGAVLVLALLALAWFLGTFVGWSQVGHYLTETGPDLWIAVAAGITVAAIVGGWASLRRVTT